MNIIRNKTLMFVVYHVCAQGAKAYFSHRSAKDLGPQVQNHESRKGSISLGFKVFETVAMSAIFGLDHIVIKK